MEILRLENLSKYYTSQTSVVMGLTNINLSFHIGEFIAITGESGSGKSTLAHVIGGILPYESGEMYINGRPTSHYDDFDREKYRRDEIGFISQNYGILEGNTVLENILCTLRFCSIFGKEAKSIAENVLKKVDLYDLKSRRAGKLSSGQKQRLSIARALAKPSKVIIADEPTGNLDRENSEKVISLLKDASKDRLVILITHEFEEAKDAATRKLVIADGNIASDISLRERSGTVSSEKTEKKSSAKKKAKGSNLVPYTTALTLKAHPIFSATVCILLALTSFIVFAFLGTFVVALDDSDTKVYTPDAFFNGDPERIVVMKPDGEPFTEEDYQKIISVRYTEGIERWGYVNDINYHYVPGEDYLHFSSEKIDNPSADPNAPMPDIIISGNDDRLTFDPDKFETVQSVTFTDTNKYIRTLPYTADDVITVGRAPTGAYEVVTADKRLKTGDRVLVYVRNLAQWSSTVYIPLIFDVVGETRHGEGLYFSDTFASILFNSTSYYEGLPLMLHRENVMLAPFSSEQLNMKDVELEEGQICINEIFAEKYHLRVNEICILYNDNLRKAMTTAHLTDSGFSRLVFLHPNDFEELHDFTASNQISVYVKDYAYLDRVLDQLGDMNYLTLSPFRTGNTHTNSALAAERLTTLYVCLGALVVGMVLQLILLRAIFSSLFGYFKLMSDVGLTSKTVYAVLALLMVIYTVIGEIIGAGSIAFLDYLRVDKIESIIKYFEPAMLSLLFAAHIISVIFATLFLIRSARKSIFNNTKQISPDLDLDGKEECEA